MTSFPNIEPASGPYAISVDEVAAAARRLVGIAVRTPMLESPLLNRHLGFRLLVKAEPLQRTGAFKFRGAYNAVSQIAPDARKAGVVAFSSGNHAQGVAAACSLLGVPATIVMPSDAPAIKVDNTRAWGAEIVLYDRKREDRDAIAAAIAHDTGATLVRPYDDRHVIAGQATVGLEIAEQAREMELSPDNVIVPCGGGGLSSGVAFAIAAESPGTRVWTAEPEGYDDTALSLAAGRRITAATDRETLCDALLPPLPGELTFPILRDFAAGGLAVGDDAVKRAMATAFEHFRLVVEPGGAVALAAVLDGRLDETGSAVVCVCSGGNVDPRLYARILGRPEP